MARRQEGVRQCSTRIRVGDTKETAYQRSCAETDRANLPFPKYTSRATNREGHNPTRKLSAPNGCPSKRQLITTVVRTGYATTN